MSKLPVWARKPKHKETVVATSLGWEVERTGELLVSVRYLDQKLKALFDEAQESASAVVTTEPTKDEEPAPVEDEEVLDESAEEEGEEEEAGEESESYPFPEIVDESDVE